MLGRMQRDRGICRCAEDGVWNIGARNFIVFFKVGSTDLIFLNLGFKLPVIVMEEQCLLISITGDNSFLVSVTVDDDLLVH